METNRRAILQLIAMGRITAAEGERLLMAWNDGRETLWAIAAAVAVICATQMHLDRLLPEWLRLAHLIQTHLLLPGSFVSVGHALSLLTQILGGLS